MSLVRARPAGHDRPPAAPDRTTADDGLPHPFDTALERLRLDGAIFLRAEYRDPWSYVSSTGPETAAILRPGTRRVLLFHVVARGACWVEGPDGVRHRAARGDVVVLPYGDQHRMGGTGDAASVPLATIMEPPPWTHLPVIRHGGPGARTDVVCGFLHTEDVLFDPAVRAFPPVFVVRLRGPQAAWVRASVDLALSQEDAAPLGPTALPSRLPELLLTEVLREHLASAPAREHGWLTALRDPFLRPALAALHADPARRWTVDELAATAAVSRSALDARFRATLGLSPIRYLAQWRMHLARDLLASTDLPVATVAHRIGYDAEEAFSRAYKRSSGIGPARWRTEHRAPAPVEPPAPHAVPHA